MPSVWRVKSLAQSSTDHAVNAVVNRIMSIVAEALSCDDVAEAHRLQGVLLQLQADVAFVNVLDTDVTLAPDKRHAAVITLLTHATKGSQCSPS